jgi:flagellar protein FlaG
MHMSYDRMKIGSTGPQGPLDPAASRKESHAAREVTTSAEQSAASGGTRAAAAATPQKIEAVAQRLESYLRSVSRSLEFRVDSASGKTVVTVRDSQTGDLIRQIPGDEVLRLAEMAEDQTIVLVNESV